jgi:hypothetical protein
VRTGRFQYARSRSGHAAQAVAVPGGVQGEYPALPGFHGRQRLPAAGMSGNPGGRPKLIAETDGEAPASGCGVALFDDAVTALAPRLTNGSQVYCEGRLAIGLDRTRRRSQGGAQPRGVGGPADEANRTAEAQGPIAR